MMNKTTALVWAMVFSWPLLSSAQDTIVFWNGKQKPVLITRMDIHKVRYKNLPSSDRELSIEKQQIMHIQSSESTKNWEDVIYGKESFGSLPSTAKGIDSLAREHVLQYYHGDHVVGSKTFWASLLGTPILGIPYAMHHSVDPVDPYKLGMMGNPHQNNPDYLNSYMKHAREQNRKRIFVNVVMGSVVISIPLGIVLVFTRGGL